MANYTVYRETATNAGLVIEGHTFKGTPDNLRRYTLKLISEGNDRKKLHITVVAFDKLQTKVIVLTRLNNVIVPPSRDVLAALPTAEEYAKVAIPPPLTTPSINDLLNS